MKFNKLRYWLGMRCVVTTDGMYAISKRGFFIFSREYYDFSDKSFWSRVYSKSTKNSVEELLNAYEKQQVRAV